MMAVLVPPTPTNENLPFGVLSFGEELVAEHTAIVEEGVPVGRGFVAERPGIDGKVEARSVVQLPMIVHVSTLNGVIRSHGGGQLDFPAPVVVGLGVGQTGLIETRLSCRGSRDVQP